MCVLGGYVIRGSNAAYNNSVYLLTHDYIAENIRTKYAIFPQEMGTVAKMCKSGFKLTLLKSK